MKAGPARRPRPPLMGDKAPTVPIPLTALPGVRSGRREEPPHRPRLIGEENARWLTSLLLVLAVYAAPLAWWLATSRPPAASAPPPAAMVVELAPLPAAPPPRVEKKVEEPPAPEPEPEPPPPVEKAEAVIPPEPEEVPPEEPPEEEPPAEEETASEAPREAEEAAAPERGAPAPAVDPGRVRDWQNRLMLRLNEVKHYPRRARRYRQQGVTYLRFTMDREGKVLEKSIERGSGHRLLDREVLALIERAQPLPAPPQEMEGETLEFVVPVEFFLDR